MPGSIGQRVGLIAGLWAASGLVLALGALSWQAGQTGELPELQPLYLLPAVTFAACSMGLRTLRWRGFLFAAGARPSLLTSLRTELVGFALTLTPGKVGEVYKCYLIERATGVSTARTAPIVLFEKLMDGVAFTGLALLAAALLPGLADAVSQGARSLLLLGIAGLVLVALFRALHANLAPSRLLPMLRWLPMGPRIGGLLEVAIQGGADVLKGPLLARNLALSLVARSCDGVAMMWAAAAVGLSLAPLEGVFVLNSSGALGGFSMLPGGIGVVEAGISLLLISLGAPMGAAMAATLLARILSFWLWVSIGLGLLLRSTLEVETTEEARSALT